MTEENPNEIRTTSPTGGQKGVKPERHSLIPVEALNSIARLYGFGAKKYDAHNWRKGYEWSKSYDAMNRHMTAFWSGEDNDPETGEPHMASVAFHAMTLMVFMQEQPGFDDRYIPERTQEPAEFDFNPVSLITPPSDVGLGEFSSTPLRRAHLMQD